MAGQDAIIAFLADPATHDGQPVHRIDTHAAHVFLVGDRALKMKRAVRYSYLDYSTLALRRAACEAEVRLNRRTAPELYLGICSIDCRADGSLGFGGGEPMEWLVDMRRFPDDALLSDVAGRGDLTPALTIRLADAIARFHQQLEPVAGDGTTRLYRVIDGNRQSMDALPEGLLPAADVDAWHAQSLEMLDRLEPLLDARARTGRVRHGHGDLHLRNICLFEGEPVLFDCLEFDAELAQTDTLYDLAFLLMDLRFRGLDWQASLLRDRYCDRMAEAEGLAALPLFLSVRAAVRAHVNAADSLLRTDSKERAELAATARRYLAAAVAHLRSPRVRLIAIGGLSGTGKSTLARNLAPHFDARVLRSDVVRKTLAGVDPESRLPPASYTPEAAAAVYGEFFCQARNLLAAGVPVIADAVFATPDERAAIATAADGICPFHGLWLEAPHEILHHRVENRHGDVSDATARVVALQQDYEIGDLVGWQRLDSSGDTERVAANAMAQLGSL
ncbi:MAG: AAA family ATPase [Sphingomonadaceae bacterium]